MSIPTKRARPGTNPEEEEEESVAVSSSLFSSPTDTIITYLLNQSYDLLQSDSCHLRRKEEAKRKLRDVIRLLQGDSDGGNNEDEEMPNDDNQIVPQNIDAKQYRSVEVQTILEMHIDQLPNEILTSTLKNIELQQLIPLKRVCAKWNDVITALCEGKLSLKLTADPPPLKPRNTGNNFSLSSSMLNFKHDHFLINNNPSNRYKVRYLNNKPLNRQRLCYWLARIFPNVLQLDIGPNLVNEMSILTLANLLKQWPNLTSLYLNGRTLGKTVLRAIGELSSLRHLYLLTTRVDEELPDALLAQLEDLFLYGSLLYDANILSSLDKLNAKCRIRFNGIYKDNQLPALTRLFTESHPRLALQVTHIDFSSFCANMDTLFLATRNCVNLENLLIFNNCANLSDLIAKLGHLNKLTELDIVTSIDITPQFMRKRYNGVRLPSLTKLTLSCWQERLDENFDGRAWCRSLRAMFPNLGLLFLHIPMRLERNAIKANLGVLGECKCIFKLKH